MKKTISLIGALMISSVFIVSVSFAVICGDGIRQGTEECDDGTQNSDSRSNACRTDCILPRCGDGVVDSGEECDDGWRNNDEIPGACRTNCKLAHCGDGVVDFALGEECEDTDQGLFDWCQDCRRCIQLESDLVIQGFQGQTFFVCEKDYVLEDQGSEGAIILNSSGITLDCRGVTLRGATFTPPSASVSSQVASQVKSLGTEDSSSRRLSKRKAKSDPEPGQGTSSAPKNVPSGPTAAIRKGTGIVIAADNVVVRNCYIHNFRTGIKIQGKGSVLLDNTICDNNKDIVATQAGNYGVKNYCSTSEGWREDEKLGCAFSCP